MESNASDDDELIRFRAEAEKALGIESVPDESDVEEETE
jgi:hypothetical protein